MELGNNQEAMQVEETSNDMGVLNRFINIIFEPAKVFESILEKPKILAPIIALIVALFVLVLPILSLTENYSKDIYEKIYKNENFLKTQNMSAESADKLIEQTSKYAKIGAFASPFTAFVLLFAETAVLFGLMKIFGGQGTFKQTFGVIAYAGIIDLIGYIVKTVNIVLTGNVEATNSFAVLMANDKLNFFYDFVSKVDLFSIWSLVVTALGLAAIHKVSKKKVCIGVFSLWVIYLLGAAASVYSSAVSMYEKFGITL